jgi:hypothetical protein
MNNRERHAAKAEKNQQKIDSGIMSLCFPEVASIVISMEYKQKGIRQPLPRTVNFYPGSYAFFRVDCLSKECVEGGFDFTNIMNKMVRNHSMTSHGEINCEGSPAPDHSSIVYDVAIQYV